MTIIQQACSGIPGFQEFYTKLLRYLTINDRAQSTITNYSRSLAQLSLHFKRQPFAISIDEIQEYLYLLKQREEDISETAFKFIICSLRVACHMEGLDEFRLSLPSIRKKRKLPVVLSKQEITAMLNRPLQIRHRMLIAILYGCGLRVSEVRKLRVDDIDLQRGVLHVRQSKGRKDRYVPLGDKLTWLLEKYLKSCRQQTWLFTGYRGRKDETRFAATFDTQYGQRSIQWAVKRAARLAGITKNINVHSLRHTYATHLLEDGTNILAIRELLGHACIKTTMIYLHVAQVDNRHRRSPLDSLSGLRVLPGIQAELKFG